MIPITVEYECQWCRDGGHAIKVPARDPGVVRPQDTDPTWRHAIRPGDDAVRESLL